MKKILKYFICLCLPFVLFDVYSHIRTHYSYNLKAQSYYQTNTFYWNYLPNVSFSVTNEDGEKVTVQSDKLGFRNASSEAKADFMLLGDSFINAANTPLEATYAQTLVNKGLSVYNAAVDGTGTCHQAYILNDYIEKVQPKVVVLHFYLGNDFRDNFLGPGLEELEYAHQKKEAPIGNEAKPAKSQELSLKNQFRSIKNFLSEKSPSIKLICDSIFNVKSQANNMSAYDRGEIMVLAFDEKKPDPDTSLAIKNTENAIESILKVIHAYNQKHQASVRLVVVGIPSKAQVLLSIREITGFETDKGVHAFLQPFVKKIDFNNPDKLLAKICSKDQIPYFSLLKPFREHIDEALYYNFDSHWNWRGQQLAASLISQWLAGENFAGSASR